MFLLYHVYVYLEFLILACTIYILAPIEELFHMGAQLIFLDTNLNNTRAQHVYEKLGFKRIAIHCDSWKNQLGELQSTVDYELTKGDFCNFKNR